MWFLFSRKAQHSRPARPTLASRKLSVKTLEDRCLLSAGGLDPTFGSGGIVTTSLGSGNSHASAVALQSSGKIIAAGNSSGGFTVARYNTNGTLDTSFGSGGSAAVSLGTYLSGAGAAAVDASDRIIVGGNAGARNGTDYLALVRFNSNGTLDKTFGSKGEVLTVVSHFQELDALQIQPNGQILAAGFGGTNAVLARYNANGSLDPTFGSNGLVISTVGYTEAGFSALALQSNGQIIAGGKVWPNTSNAGVLFAVARFNSNGRLDSTFAVGGVATTSMDGNGSANWDDGVHGLAIQSNGMIVAAGAIKHLFGSANDWTDEVALARYDAHGSLDPSFGTGGIAFTPASSDGVYDAARAVALQSDGRIVTAGVHSDTSGSSFEVERYSTAGILDDTFGNGGIVTTPIGQSVSGYAMTLQSNGDIVVAGDSYDGTRHNFALARYLPSEPQVGSFTASQSAAGAPVTLTASNITDGNPSSTVTQVAFYYFDSSGNQITVGTVRAPDGSGNWILNASLPTGTFTLYAQAEDSYGVFGDPVALTLTVQ